MIQKGLFIIIMVCTSFTMFGQECLNDSLQLKIPKHHHFGSEKQISIRVGFGVQKSLYTELGLAFHKCNYGETGFFSNDLYSAVEWIPNKKRGIYGVKIGYEVNAFLLNLGLEVKYQTDFKEKDIVITPKIGLGLFGDLNIFYGYNISSNMNPFSQQIGRHQFSIIFNFNNHFLSYQ